MARSTSPTTRNTTTPSTDDGSAVTVKRVSGTQPGLISVTLSPTQPQPRAITALLCPVPSHPALSDASGGRQPCIGMYDSASPKCLVPVQSTGTQVGNRVLEGLKSCLSHLALGEVATRDLGVAGNPG